LFVSQSIYLLHELSSTANEVSSLSCRCHRHSLPLTLFSHAIQRRHCSPPRLPPASTHQHPPRRLPPLTNTHRSPSWHHLCLYCHALGRPSLTILAPLVSLLPRPRTAIAHHLGTTCVSTATPSDGHRSPSWHHLCLYCHALGRPLRWCFQFLDDCHHSPTPIAHHLGTTCVSTATPSDGHLGHRSPSWHHLCLYCHALGWPLRWCFQFLRCANFSRSRGSVRSCLKTCR
jgi:hypothetical protein